MAIIYIESNTTGFGLEVAERSAAYEDTYFLTKSPSKYGFTDTILDKINIVSCDTSSFKDVERAIRRIENVSYVASTSDAFVEIAAHASHHFGLTGNCPKAVRLCRDKHKMQHILERQGVAYPATFSHIDEIPAHAFPIIAKPREGTGSVGVHLLSNRSEIRMREQTEYIFQEFVTGREFSVETFTDEFGHHILGITRKFTTKPPHFLEIAHTFPTVLAPEVAAQIHATVKNGLDAVGYKFGPAHTEIKIRDKEIFVIEINPRLAGGMIPKLMGNAFGWSIPDLYIKSHISGISQFFVPDFRFFNSVAFVIPTVGRPYVGLLFPNECESSGQFRHAGTNDGKYDFSDRAGYVIGTGLSERAATRAAITLRNKTRIIYEPPERTPTAQDVRRLVRSGAAYTPPPLIESILRIEKAHLLMLYRQGIINKESLLLLKEAVLEVEADTNIVTLQESDRGTYIDYENHIIERCGKSIGGMVHCGRSRNDINALHLIFVLQHASISIIERVLEFSSALIDTSRKNLSRPLPIYSQFQTALPGTVAHYLASICEPLLEKCGHLLNTLMSMKRSPLGASAGGGTSFNTDTAFTAELLGFSEGPLNSLAAISDKSNALRWMSSFLEISAALNRMVIDLQLWTMKEIDFVGLPEAMYGRSSAMPQKRNPYVLEWLRLQHVQNIGTFTAALTSISHLPTGNSYQASQSALTGVTQLSNAVLSMLLVLTYAAKGLEFHDHNTEAATFNAKAFATLAAENLVTQGRKSFREAHEEVDNAMSSTPVLYGMHNAPDVLIMTEITSAIELSERVTGGGGPARALVGRTLEKLTHTKQRSTYLCAEFKYRLASAQNNLNVSFKGA
ncbi:ATP-grasp domain-containing protein [Ochrobactrum sp. XJ1]|nr:ATP-grasp domain-containing protein [Ochrobactrum sp. XJ1]